MRLLKACTILLLTAVIGPMTFARDTTATFDGYADMLYASNHKIHQDIYYKSNKSFDAKVKVTGYYFKGDDDSMRMFSIDVKSKIKKGVNILRLDYSGSNDYQLNADFAKILRDKDLVIPGSYKIKLSVSNALDKDTFRYTGFRQVDSNIDFTSGIGKGLASRIADLGIDMPTHVQQTSAAGKITRLAARYFTKKGLTQVKYEHGDTATIELYYNNWFVGKYEVNKASTGIILNQAKDFANGNLSVDFANNKLGSYQSLMSQIKAIKKDTKENNTMSGVISVSNNYSNDQEAYSDQDNYYYEVAGTLDVPVFSIPITIDGYYTSQDKHRPVKASYINFHYDADKAKEQLARLISSYNESAARTMAQGGSYKMIYGNMVQELNAAKEEELAKLKGELGVNAIDPSNMNEDYIKGAAERYVENTVKDSTGNRLQNGKDSLMKNSKVKDKYERAMKLYRKVLALEMQIQKYKQALVQYQKVLEYDSLLAYNKLQNMKHIDQMSYKDMVKSASDILPEGKAKRFVTGLTNFDVGIFPKTLSSYTFSGQTLKGLDVGYDVGFSTIGASYGTVEYIGRDGTMEQYKAYSARIQSKSIAGQQFGFIYYAYAPSQQLIKEDGFFKSTDFSLPSFRNKVQIVSGTYQGALTKLLSVSGELAYAKVIGQSEAAADANNSFKNNTSYNVTLDGQVPKTTINISGTYEHVGSGFENNTLPIVMPGVDRYSIAGNGTFFRSYLRVGIQYSGLLQNNLYGKSTNAQWGFDIATQSRRFPNIYLSYKPFSTFRSFADTLSIAQKPILGAVWTGRGNYIFKKNKHVWQFVLLYNRNNSISDSVNYSSSLFQATASYTFNKTMFSLNIGSSHIHTNIAPVVYPQYNNNTFVNIMAGLLVTPPLYISPGIDLAFNESGVCRYGLSTGLSYNFKRLPFTIRANMRYDKYKMELSDPWKNIYAGGIDITWKFNCKLYDNYR